MSQILRLEVSDRTYTALQTQATAAGVSPDKLAAATLEQQFGTHCLTEDDKKAARQRFKRHFGEVNMGFATGADNESIDADLAREYAKNHEEE